MRMALVVQIFQSVQKTAAGRSAMICWSKLGFRADRNLCAESLLGLASAQRTTFDIFEASDLFQSHMSA